jgi:vanillate O-demethylase ferredoxin subunit
MRFLIARIVDHGAAVKEFHLRREDCAPQPAWQPGAHVLLRFAAADGQQFEKHYSLVGDVAPADTYRIAVQREEQGHGGSRCLHDEFVPGSAVELSGPFNSFPLDATRPPAARVLLIAGGIGITPMVSMAYALSAASTSFALHYLVHSRDRLVLLDELNAIAHGAITPHVSQETGRADLAALLGPYSAGDSCYACGPVALLQALAATAAQLGWPASALHVESFGARADDSDGTLRVELSLSQMTIDVPPGTPILEALIAADVFVSYDCKRGECGNCYTPVLEGQPLHRDVCLTPAMRATGLCTCVSWAAAPGRLMLEI